MIACLVHLVKWLFIVEVKRESENFGEVDQKISELIPALPVWNDDWRPVQCFYNTAINFTENMFLEIR